MRTPIRRREFITLLGGAAAWPLAALAQQPSKTARIGILSLNAGPTPNFEGLQRGLRELGYVEGQNLINLYRWSAGRKDRLTDLASELLQLKVDLFASNSTEAITAIRSVSKTIPIVMTGISDPIDSGLVASLARPGGNTTGVTLLSTDLAGKRLQLLKEAVPHLERVAIITERDHPSTATLVEHTKAAAKALSVSLQIIEVLPQETVEAFRSISNEHAQAVIVQSTASLSAYMRQIADLAIDYHLPTVHEQRALVEAGGLMSYGPSFFDLGKRSAWYVDRILRGTNPADLPVEQPTKFEFVVNLKTAKALGLTVSPNLLAIADVVIE